MSEEYITRKAARDVLSALAIRHFELSDLFKIYIKALEDADAEILKIPAADVEPVRRGKFTRHVLKNANVPWGVDCSACGAWFVIGEDTAEKYNYCPNCGARMDGET